MKRAILIILAYGAGIIGCNTTLQEELNNVKYNIFGQRCIHPKEDVYFLVDMVGKTAEDSTFVNTKLIGKKLEIAPKMLKKNSSFYSLLNVLCVDDSIYMEIPVDSFYGAFDKKVPYFLKQSDWIKLHITLLDRLSPKKYHTYKLSFEERQIQEYLEKYNWNAETDSNNIFFEKLKHNSDSSSFEEIKLKYIIKTIDERLISYSKEGDPLVYNINDKNILKGIRILANKLQPGEKLKAVIPSSLAYGTYGNKTVVPYTPLIVELEYLEKIR